MMGVLTEGEVRKMLKDCDLKEIEVTKDTIITPSAKQYLADKNIKIKVIEKKHDSNYSEEKTNKDDGKIFPKYECLNGGFLESKPEHMTQLYGNKLVPKNHKRIILRGKLDSLQSKILETQILAQKLNATEVVANLDEILGFVRNILRAEVLNEPLDKFTLIGLSEDEIREMSHNPNKYFGVNHFLPNYKQGELIVYLNSLRSLTREIEICAYEAFLNQDGELIRNDIVRYLNRLSSCFYVMMLKCLKELSSKKR